MTRLNLNLPRIRGTKLAQVAALMLAATLLAGCGTTKKEVDPTSGWTAERLYKDAREEMSAGNWKDARTRLEAVE